MRVSAGGGDNIRMRLPPGPEESCHTSPSGLLEVPGVQVWLGRVCAWG
jgi:hypothetical protein